MIFNEAYNKESFSDFIRSFLPEDFVEKEQDLSHIQSCKVINRAVELGKSQSLGVHVLEMNHDKESDPRVSIATDAFRILATYQIDKALVIFNSKNSKNYRLSLLTISLDVDEKNKLTKSYSNARRFSFYLGPGAKVRTPEQQLVTKGRVKDLNDLVSRFSLEVVNKQFYLELAKHFDSLVDKEKKLLSLPFQTDPNIRKSFAMRLIGRIMFCWFLKQKHSPTDGPLVPDELLSTKAVENGYYHNILEPLFFGLLNTPIEGRDIRGELYDSVPYLNGGLFNPQHDDFYDLDREMLVSRYINTLVVSDEWFREFFKLLETYNFTIDENTVFDQELSVDPEMLGRIFENLLAEINPETGSSERKRTGSYYTPRQIVEYMVDRSLIEHLKTKTDISEDKLEALVSYDLSDDTKNPLTLSERKLVIDAIDSLRLLDPACGSGAFPIGALQKIVWILQRVDADCELWLEKKLARVPELYRQKIRKDAETNPFDYTRKLDVIKNSIFGVDIQPIAVEIARLRCFLTLVVESEVNDTKPNRGVEPLPNLDFKFVCANTLVPAPEENSGGNQLFADDFDEKLSAAIDRYFSSYGANKSSAGNDIHRLIDSKVDQQLKYVQGLISHSDERYKAALAKTHKKSIDAHARILTLWASYKNLFENKPVGFFDPKYFFPGIKEGFDIVIGNPPYVKEDINKAAFDGLRDSECYQGKMDLWYLFGCRGIDLLVDNGVLSFIAINNWTTNDGASKFRNKIISDSQIISFTDFSDFKVFSAGVQTMILIAKKSKEKETYFLQYKKFLDSEIPHVALSEFLSTKKTVGGVVDVYDFELSRSTCIDDYINFVPSETNKLLNKLQHRASFHIRDEEIYSGIDVMQDFVTRKHLADISTPVQIGDGIFVLSNEEVESLDLSDNERNLLKPYYTAKELGRYQANPKNKFWIIYAGSELNETIDNYPNIKAHLDKFRGIITSVNKPYGLHRTRDPQIFLGEKIFSLRKCARPTFSYTNFPCYVSRAFLIIKTARVNQKYLTGILNSKIVAFWLRHKGKMQGSNYQIDKGPLENLPLIQLDEKAEKRVVDLVDQIIAKSTGSNSSEIRVFEDQIDHLLYQQYSLTNDEIRTIEEAVGQ